MLPESCGRVFFPVWLVMKFKLYPFLLLIKWKYANHCYLFDNFFYFCTCVQCCGAGFFCFWSRGRLNCPVIFTFYVPDIVYDLGSREEYETARGFEASRFWRRSCAVCNRSLNCYLVFTTSVPQNYCVLTRFRLHKMISSPISSGSTK